MTALLEYDNVHTNMSSMMRTEQQVTSTSVLVGVTTRGHEE